MTAYRTALLLPRLAPMIRVVSFGSIAWASPEISALFDGTLGRRSVQLVLSRRVPPPAATAPLPLWWVTDAETRRWHSYMRRVASLLAKLSGGGGGGVSSSPPRMSRLSLTPRTPHTPHTPHTPRTPRTPRSREPSRECVAFDPLVCAPVGRHGQQSPDFWPLENVLACNQGAATIDKGATALLPRARVAQAALHDLMADKLPDGHALHADYHQLHLGKQYRTLMVDMLRRYRELKAAHAACVGAAQGARGVDGGGGGGGSGGGGSGSGGHDDAYDPLLEALRCARVSSDYRCSCGSTAPAHDAHGSHGGAHGGTRGGARGGAHGAAALDEGRPLSPALVRITEASATPVGRCSAAPPPAEAPRDESTNRPALFRTSSEPPLGAPSSPHPSSSGGD
eukprot:310764-Prymnesium_polylepis.1